MEKILDFIGVVVLVISWSAVILCMTGFDDVVEYVVKKFNGKG